jgi:hypothetical protein
LKLGLDIPLDFAIGFHFTSPPHLIWSCRSTRDLAGRAALHAILAFAVIHRLDDRQIRAIRQKLIILKAACAVWLFKYDLAPAWG